SFIAADGRYLGGESRDSTTLTVRLTVQGVAIPVTQVTHTTVAVLPEWPDGRTVGRSDCLFRSGSSRRGRSRRSPRIAPRPTSTPPTSRTRAPCGSTLRGSAGPSRLRSTSTSRRAIRAPAEPRRVDPQG